MSLKESVLAVLNIFLSFPLLSKGALHVPYQSPEGLSYVVDYTGVF